MKNKHSQTAILLFAQTAKADTASKSLVDRSVMDILNARALKTIKSSGLDYYHFTEREQRGNNFASRFTNSIQDVFEMGYESVICLGNDTPLLTVNLIEKAAIALKNGHTVKGKSLDGGLYLIGLHRNDFNATTFKNLAWQTPQLATSFNHYIKELNRNLVVLQSLQDIDSTAALHQFMAGKDARIEIVGLLLNTLSRKQISHHHTAQKTIQVALLQPANKGSPVALAA